MSEAQVPGRRADLSLEVGADADDAPPGGHLEGEADHPSDLQQSLLTQAPAALRTDKRSVVTSHLRRDSVQSADHCSTLTYEQRSAPFSPAHWTALTHLAASVCTFMLLVCQFICPVWSGTANIYRKLYWDDRKYSWNNWKTF